MTMMTKARLEKYINPVFLETGSGNGDGIRRALEAGFGRVISVELSERHYERAQKRFADDRRVTIHHGASQEVLPKLLAELDSRATFWLDAHANSEGEILEAQGFWSPIMQELELIAEHRIRDHTILVDDVRLLGPTRFGSETSLDKVQALIRSINPGYRFRFEDGDKPGSNLKRDILVATCRAADRSFSPRVRFLRRFWRRYFLALLSGQGAAPPAPPREVPAELRDAFTLGGEVLEWKG